MGKIHKGTCVMGEKGFHASTDLMAAMRHAEGKTLCLVECEAVASRWTEKLVCARQRILCRFDATHILRDFARESAVSVVSLWAVPYMMQLYLERGGEDVRAIVTGEDTIFGQPTADGPRDSAAALAEQSAWYAVQDNIWETAYKAEMMADYAADRVTDPQIAGYRRGVRQTMRDWLSRQVSLVFDKGPRKEFQATKRAVKHLGEETLSRVENPAAAVVEAPWEGGIEFMRPVDIWQVNSVDARCVPINCERKGDGALVMGKGLALEAANLYPRLPMRWGAAMHAQLTGKKKPGLLVCDDPGILGRPRPVLVGFPTKIDWRQPSLPWLIEDMLKELSEMAEFRRWKTVCLPMLGCGYGQLSWHGVVKPLMIKCLATKNVLWRVIVREM